MALIKCKECGHTISDQAVICPNCGAKKIDAVGVPSPEGMKVLGGILLLIGLSFYFLPILLDIEQKYSLPAMLSTGLGLYLLTKKFNKKIDDTDNDKKFVCSDCKKEVLPNADKCPYCGTTFDK